MVMVFGVGVVGFADYFGGGVEVHTVAGVDLGAGFSTAPVVSTAESHTIALRNDGTVCGWGSNTWGQVGDGTVANRRTPVQVQGLNTVTAISAGWTHTIALRNDGTVWGWGTNSRGQLGDDTTTSRRTPIQVQGLNNITAVSAGWDYTIALRNDGTVWSWGNNELGQLGDGTTTNRHTPVQVQGLNNVAAVSAGVNHTVALRNDGTVWAWGTNWSGQLGDGTTTHRHTPVQVQGLDNVTAVSAGGNHTIALRNDGTVWALGRNLDGQLGDGTTTTRRTPMQMKGLNNVTAVSAGSDHTIALRNDGTVWASGRNLDGQLGDGTTTLRHTSVQVEGLNNVIAVSAGAWHTIALRNDGTVWGWGRNWGQLGDGTTTNRHTPVQVIGENDVGHFNVFEHPTTNISLNNAHGGVGEDIVINGSVLSTIFDANTDTITWSVSHPDAIEIVSVVTNNAPITQTESLADADFQGFSELNFLDDASASLGEEITVSGMFSQFRYIVREENEPPPSFEITICNPNAVVFTRSQVPTERASVLNIPIFSGDAVSMGDYIVSIPITTLQSGTFTITAIARFRSGVYTAHATLYVERGPVSFRNLSAVVRANRDGVFTVTATGIDGTSASATVTVGLDTITVTWNANRGTHSSTGNSILTTTRIAGYPIYIMPGTLLTPQPPPQRSQFFPHETAYVFLGWFDTHEPTGGNEITRLTQTPNYDVTYWARWSNPTRHINWWYRSRNISMNFSNRGEAITRGEQVAMESGMCSWNISSNIHFYENSNSTNTVIVERYRPGHPFQVGGAILRFQGADWGFGNRLGAIADNFTIFMYREPIGNCMNLSQYNFYDAFTTVFAHELGHVIGLRDIGLMTDSSLMSGWITSAVGGPTGYDIDSVNMLHGTPPRVLPPGPVVPTSLNIQGELGQEAHGDLDDYLRYNNIPSSAPRIATDNQANEPVDTIMYVFHSYSRFRNITHLASLTTDIVRVEVLDSRVERLNTWGYNPPEEIDPYSIYTIYRLRVMEVFQGDTIIEDIIEVRQLGGQLDGLRVNTEKAPLIVGNEAVIFLYASHIEGLPHVLLNPYQTIYHPTANGTWKGAHLSNDFTFTIPELEEIIEIISRPRIGDLTGNNHISIMDVALLRTHVMGMGHTLSAGVQTRIAQGAGNVAGNPDISIMDVALLRTYVMGMSHTLSEDVQARLSWNAKLNP